MSLPLYAVEKEGRGRIYCGPFCMVAVTGEPYPKVRAAINASRGREHNAPVMGTGAHTLRDAFHQLGWRMWNTHEYGKNEGPTLAAWLKSGLRDKAHYCLVELTHHWVLIAGTRFVDTHTKQPVALSEAPWRRARVHRAFAVYKE